MHILDGYLVRILLLTILGDEMEKSIYDHIKDAIDMGCKEDWEIISWLTAGGFSKNEAKKALDSFKKGGVESGVRLSLGSDSLHEERTLESFAGKRLGESETGSEKDRNRNRGERI